MDQIIKLWINCGSNYGKGINYETNGITTKQQINIKKTYWRVKHIVVSLSWMGHLIKTDQDHILQRIVGIS